MFKRNLKIAKALVGLARKLVADESKGRFIQRYSFDKGYDFTEAKRDTTTAFIYQRSTNCPMIKIKVSGDMVAFSLCCLGEIISDMSKGKSHSLSSEAKEIYNEAGYLNTLRNMRGRRGKDFDQLKPLEKFEIGCQAAMNLLMKNPDQLDSCKGETWTTTKQEAYKDLIGIGGFHKQAVAKFLGVEASSENTFDYDKFRVTCPEDFKESAVETIEAVAASGLPENLLYGAVEFIPFYENKNMIVDGDYDKGTDSMRIAMGEENLFDGTSPIGTMIHELGHRWWYKIADYWQKNEFRKMYGDASKNRKGYFFPTEYSNTSVEEFVGDCFRCYYHDGLKDGEMKELIKNVINRIRPQANLEEEDNIPAMDVSGMETKPFNVVLEMELGDVTFTNLFRNHTYNVSLPIHMTEKGYNDIGEGFNNPMYISNDKKNIYYNITKKEAENNTGIDFDRNDRYDKIDRILYTVDRERKNNAYRYIQDEEAYQKKRPSNPNIVINALRKMYLNDENRIYHFLEGSFRVYFTEINDVRDFIDRFDTIEELKKAYPKYDLNSMGNIIKETLAYRLVNDGYFMPLKAKYKLDATNMGIISDEISKYLIDFMSKNEAQYVQLCTEVFHRVSDFSNKGMAKFFGHSPSN